MMPCDDYLNQLFSCSRKSSFGTSRDKIPSPQRVSVAVNSIFNIDIPFFETSPTAID